MWYTCGPSSFYGEQSYECLERGGGEEKEGEEERGKGKGAESFGEKRLCAATPRSDTSTPRSPAAPSHISVRLLSPPPLFLLALHSALARLARARKEGGTLRSPKFQHHAS